MPPPVMTPSWDPAAAGVGVLVGTGIGVLVDVGTGVLVGVAVAGAGVFVGGSGVGVGVDSNPRQRSPFCPAVAVLPFSDQASPPVSGSVLKTKRWRPGLKSTGWPRSTGAGL